MKVLLDTHILIWTHSDDSNLSVKAREIIQNPLNEIYYSAISIWETQIKHLKYPKVFTLSGETLNSLCIKAAFKCVDVCPEHTYLLQSLSYSKNAPRDHKDPFDRMLLCQAKAENLSFLTHDELIPFYNEDCVISV